MVMEYVTHQGNRDMNNESRKERDLEKRGSSTEERRDKVQTAEVENSAQLRSSICNLC